MVQGVNQNVAAIYRRKTVVWKEIPNEAKKAQIQLITAKNIRYLSLYHQRRQVVVSWAACLNQVLTTDTMHKLQKTPHTEFPHKYIQHAN